MALASVLTYLRKGRARPNPNDIQTYPCVIGLASSGAINVPTLLVNMLDCAQFGFGEGIEQAAEILTRGGGPVIFTRCNQNTAGSLGTTLKIPAAVSSATLYGGLLLPGVDGNGDVYVTAKQTGVSIELLGGTSTSLLATPTDNGDGTVTVSIQLATSGMSVVTTTGTLLAAEIAAHASTYLSAVAEGTGASISVAMTLTAISNGDIAYTPRQDGVTVRHLASGNNTSLSVSVSTKAVTVNLATGAAGKPTSTAAAIVAKIALSSAASLLLSGVASGDGTGTAGIKTATTLTFGSTAALTLSGTPVDGGNIRIKSTRIGTVGSTTAPPAIQWSWDGGLHWSGEKLVPSSGIVLLSDSKFTSGITATWANAGVFAVDDLWLCEATGPTATVTEVSASATVALADTSKTFGYLTGLTVLSAADAGEIDTALQAARQRKNAAGLFGVRDETAAENESAWRAAIELDFQGYTSTRGLLRMACGYLSHASPLTGRTFWRPATMLASSRRSSIPVHENLGKTDRGQIAGLGAAMPGKLLVAGVDGNGGVEYHARESGVSIVHMQQSGASKPLLVSVDDTTKTITVSLGTSGGSAANTLASDIVSAVNALVASNRYVIATAQGTGASVSAEVVSTLIQDRKISHDEFLQEGLEAARFVTTRTYDQAPGEIFFGDDPTMADESEAGWTQISEADVGLSIARIAAQRAWYWLQRSLPSIAAAESDAVPRGALVASTASAIGTDVGSYVEAFLFKRKEDGEASAGPYPDGEHACVVLRDYSYKDTRTVKMEVGWNSLVSAKFITIDVTPQ